MDKRYEMRPNWPRAIALILIIGVLFALGHWGSGWLTGIVKDHIGAYLEAHRLHIILAGITLYAALMAIPFLPGMEISLAMLAIFGPSVAVSIYIATVAALSFAYAIGRNVPLQVVGRLFDFLGLERAGQLMNTLQPMNRHQRLEFIVQNAPKRIVPTLLKHRYLALIAALNIPGNAMIGGGGGISLIAGLSGMFSFPLFLIAISIAALPVPLFVFLSSQSLA